MPGGCEEYQLVDLALDTGQSLRVFGEELYQRKVGFLGVALLRQTGGRINLLLHSQSAVRGPEPLRCCSPINRAGFTAGWTNGQSLPVTEHHRTVGTEGQ